LLVILSFAMGHSAHAHPADLSHLRVKLERDQVEFRFSLNLATVARITTLDTDQSHTITVAEIDKTVPAVREFLLKAVLVSINDDDASLGSFTGHECIWPNPETSVITTPDAGQRYVDFTFVMPWPKGVREVWLGLQWFPQLGDQHTTQAIYHRPGEHDHAVEFSLNEPEYLYDTGWTEEVPAAASPPEPPTPMREPWSRGWLLLGGLVLVMLWRWWSAPSTVRRK
jgi:hypothetical protein